MDTVASFTKARGRHGSVPFHCYTDGHVATDLVEPASAMTNEVLMQVINEADGLHTTG